MISPEYTAVFVIDEPMKDVFPLFTPEGERHWAPGWDFDEIMQGAEISEDYVFTTRHHDHAGSDAVWIVKKYDREQAAIQYYRIEPEIKVGIVSVTCSTLDNITTNVRVTYKYIGLSEQGDKFIRHYSQEEYDHFIAGWKVHIDQYFHHRDRVDFQE